MTLCKVLVYCENLLHTVQARSYGQGEWMFLPMEGLIKSNAFYCYFVQPRNCKVYLSYSIFPSDMSEVCLSRFARSVLIKIPWVENHCCQMIAVLTHKQSDVGAPLDILAPLQSPKTIPLRNQNISANLIPLTFNCERSKSGALKSSSW